MRWVDSYEWNTKATAMQKAFEGHKKEKVNRPDWNHYFLSIAQETAKRSPDAQTQCGCVFVKNNRILGTGYNGYAAGINDTYISNVRPEKYPWMIHAEINCILNSKKKKNIIAYITGLPCFPCLNTMYAFGVRSIYCGPQASVMRDDDKEYRKLVDAFKLCASDKFFIQILDTTK